MENSSVLIAIKVLIFFSIIKVWLFNFNKPTRWRGKDARSMSDEFEVYGLSRNMMLLVGGAKILFSALLLASIWYEPLAVPSAAGIAILMFGAIIMHIKVKDPLIKSFPAFTFLLLSLVIILAGSP